MVIQEKYGKIALTEKGISAAEEIYKKHKILSKFINKVLGVNELTAEIDACKLEHVLSAETLLGMKKYLNKILESITCDNDKLHIKFKIKKN